MRGAKSCRPSSPFLSQIWRGFDLRVEGGRQARQSVEATMSGGVGPLARNPGARGGVIVRKRLNCLLGPTDGLF